MGLHKRLAFSVLHLDPQQIDAGLCWYVFADDRFVTRVVRGRPTDLHDCLRTRGLEWLGLINSDHEASWRLRVGRFCGTDMSFSGTTHPQGLTEPASKKTASKGRVLGRTSASALARVCIR